MSMNPVVHFELPGDDRERMKKFYAEAFGWEYNQLGEDMGNYTVVMTSESDEMGPKEKGRINGGLYLRTDQNVSQHPSVVISVDDIAAHIQKVKDAGGTVVDEPMEIPGVGMFVSIIDTEGNHISMLQPKM